MSSYATCLYGTKIMGTFHALSIINERRRALAVIGFTCRALKTNRILEKISMLHIIYAFLHTRNVLPKFSLEEMSVHRAYKTVAYFSISGQV